MNQTNGFPLLRYREGDRERKFDHIMTLMGQLTAVEETTFKLHQGRDRYTDIFLEDFAPFLGGMEMARALLADAVAHGDHIKLGIAHERITYENQLQTERFEALVRQKG
jgi:hypothetical protein